MISKEYLSFTKRERRGIITLVSLLIIVALMPRFCCNPKPVVEKQPDKILQPLVQRDTIPVYIKQYITSGYKNGYRPASPSLNWKKDRYKKPNYTTIDINTADTTAFIALPGIGSKLANRIVSFRSKLGGFNSVEQIREVYGLKDSVFQLIYPMLTVKL